MNSTMHRLGYQQFVSLNVDTYQRDGYVGVYAKKYFASLEAGIDLPAVAVAAIGDSFYLLDGHQRQANVKAYAEHVRNTSGQTDYEAFINKFSVWAQVYELRNRDEARRLYIVMNENRRNFSAVHLRQAGFYDRMPGYVSEFQAEARFLKAWSFVVQLLQGDYADGNDDLKFLDCIAGQYAIGHEALEALANRGWSEQDAKNVLKALEYTADRLQAWGADPSVSGRHKTETRKLFKLMTAAVARSPKISKPVEKRLEKFCKSVLRPDLSSDDYQAVLHKVWADCGINPTGGKHQKEYLKFLCNIITPAAEAV